MAALIIARLTLREASRRRLLLAVAVLTVVVALLSGWAFHRLLEFPCGSRLTGTHPCPAAETKLLAATLLILLMFMFSFVLALGAAFLGAPTIANDVESGVLLSILPRPIRRSDVFLGKWLGLSLLLALYAGISCGIEFIIGRFTFSYVPPHPILAIVFVVAEAVMVLTLTMAISTRLPAMTGGIIVLIVFGITWMGGMAGSVGAVVHSQSVENIGTVSSLILPSDGLWRGAVYNLQPAAVITLEESAGEATSGASGNPFFVTSPVPAPYLLWCLGWAAVILGTALWSFNRREL